MSPVLYNDNQACVTVLRWHEKPGVCGEDGDDLGRHVIQPRLLFSVFFLRRCK
jgi:hypothetical protein